MACYWSFRLVFERGRFYLLIIFQAIELISPRVVNASLGSARCHCTCADVIQLRLRECVSASVLSHLFFGQLLYYIRSLRLAIHSFLFRCALSVAKLTRRKKCACITNRLLPGTAVLTFSVSHQYSNCLATCSVFRWISKDSCRKPYVVPSQYFLSPALLDVTYLFFHSQEAILNPVDGNAAFSGLAVNTSHRLQMSKYLSLSRFLTLN